MKQQAVLIPTNGNQRASKTTKKVVSKAFMGIIIFIALTMVFTAGATFIRPAVDSVTTQFAGTPSEGLTAEAATPSWTNPYVNNGAYTSKDVVLSTTTPTSMTLVPSGPGNSIDYSNWVAGHKTTDQNAISADGSISALYQTTGPATGSLTATVLFYVDITIDEFAQNAIRNGLITKCSVALNMSQVGTEGGTGPEETKDCYVTFFICSGDDLHDGLNKKDAELDDMSNTFYEKAVYEEYINGVKKNVGASAEQLTIALKETSDGRVPTKIRFGAAAYIKYQDYWASSGEKTIKVPIPDITQAFKTDTYANPSIEVRLSEDSRNSFVEDDIDVEALSTSLVEVTGTYKNEWYDNGKITLGKKYTAGYSNDYTFGGTSVGSIMATVIPNYYFAGWTFVNNGGAISGGTRNYRNRDITLKGGAFLKGDVVLYANYKRIELADGSSTVYTYQQEEVVGGEYISVPQGPEIKGNFVDATGTSPNAFATIAGTYYNGTINPGGDDYYSGITRGGDTYKGETAPCDAGEGYEYIVCVYQQGDTGNVRNGLLGYRRETFRIDPVSLANKDLVKYYSDGSGIDDWVFSENIPSRPYTGSAYQPAPQYVKIKANIDVYGDIGVITKEYRLEYGKDFVVAGYVNNVTVGKANLSIKAAGTFNFEAECKQAVSFNITPISAEGLQIDPVMAEEIKQVYGLEYTSAEQRPDVVLLKVLVPQYDNGINGEEVGLTPQPNGEFKQIVIYKKDGAGTIDSNKINTYYPSLIPQVNTLHTTYFIETDNLGEKYYNNIDVCTHTTDTEHECSCAYFVIRGLTGNIVSEVDDGNGGTKEIETKVYFNIAQLELDGKDFIAKEQTFNENITTYTGNEIVPVPDSVTIEVYGVTYWVRQSSGYIRLTSNRNVPLSFKVYRDGFTPDQNEGYCGVFNNEFTYSDNTDVAYDDANQVMAKAGVAITFKSGSIIASNGRKVISTFKIYPRDISKSFRGAPVAYVTDSKGNKSIPNQVYTGMPIEPDFNVYASPNIEFTSNVNNSYLKLILDKDYTRSFENNVNVTTEAKIIITGKGNYTGTFVDSGDQKNIPRFAIVAFDISKANAIVTGIKNQTYTGAKLLPTTLESMGLVETIVRDGSAVNYAVLTLTITGTSHFGADPIVIEIIEGVDFVFNTDDARTGLNRNVADDSYIGIDFLGADPNGANAGKSANTIVDDYGNVYPGNRFFGSLSVAFVIEPKHLENVSFAQASWAQYPEHVTYDGKPKTESLNIIAFGQPGVLETDNQTIVLRDSFIEQGQEKTVTLKYGIDYQLASTNTYGENINAGIGIIRVEGLGNFVDSIIELPFDIYKRELGQGRDFFSVKLSTEGGYVVEEEVDGELVDVYYYYFTGNKIEPILSECIYYVDADYSVPFDSGVAYDLVWGDENDTELNYSSTKGGTVTLKATKSGNFIGEKTYTFKIVPRPIDQYSVTLRNPGEDASNQGLLVAESIATTEAYAEGKYTFYADYEFTEAGLANGISLYAESEALGVCADGVNTAANLRFVFRDHDGKDVSTGFIVEYKNLVAGDNNLTANGKSYCYATIVPVSSQSGIVYVSAIFNDVNYDEKESEQAYHLYVKMVDKSESTILNEGQTINKVYGNPTFVFDAKLLSYTSYRFEYSVSSSAPEIAGINWQNNEGSLRYTAITLGNAGEAIITVSHEGYVNANNPEQAFIAFNKSFTVKVEPRDLIISFNELTIEYGTNPLELGLFEYTYITNGNKYGTEDTNTGLIGADVSIDDIVTEYSVAYTDAHINSTIGDNGVSVPYEIGFRSVGAKPGDLYNNYNITYAPGRLHVVKKLLNIALFQNVNGVTSSRSNQIIKTYGTPNPTDYTITMAGLAYSDLQVVVEKEEGYEAPTVKYGTIVTLTSPTTQTYTVKLSGGKAKNYSFPEVDIIVIVEKAKVKIATTNFTEDYSGDNVDLVKLAPQITGVGNGCAEPIDATDASRLTYRFRSGSTWGPGVPVRAGTYDVEITFNALAEDNYATTTVTKLGAITINKVAPLIDYEYYNTVSYTGKGIESTNYPAFVRAINDRADVPLNVKIERYAVKHVSDDTTDPSYVPNVNGTVLTDGIPLGFDTTLPVKVGRYDVVVEYVAKEADNYKSVTMLFEGCLCIITGAVEAKLKSDQYVKAFDNKPFAITMSDFEYVYYKLDGLPCVLDNEPEIFFRAETGREVAWDKNAPLNAGTYSVMLKYTPSDNEIANNLVSYSEIRFPNCIVIEKFNLLSQNGHIYKDYTGTYDGGVYDSKTHKLPDGSIVVKGREGNEDGPKGSLLISYVKDGIVYDAPIDVGTYDVVVSYVEGKNDNYCAIKASTNNTITFASAIIISKAVAQIDNAQSQVVYVYNGNGRAYGSVAIIGVLLDSGAFERPKGTLKYKYRLNGVTGAFTEVLPKDVGRYDVEVTYLPASDDNYKAGEPVVLENVIVIEPALPSISITNKTYAFGEPVYYTQGAGYVVSGPPSDTNGPFNETGTSGIGSQIVVQYGTRYTTADGTAGYDWLSEAPTLPGKYSVRVSFIAADGSNFLSHSNFATDCLVILNETPDLSLENKTVYYNGKQHSANAAEVSKYGIPYNKYFEGIDDEEHAYRGNLSYEYRRGNSPWTGVAPTEVGVYDVKVTYNANANKDVFAPYSQEFAKALVIEKLNITIMPVYGLGHLYDGESMDTSDTTFVYSYQENGYTYLKYATIGNLGKNEIIDLSSSTFTDANGNVYTIVTNTSLTSDAWRDYYQTELRYVSGSFNDGVSAIAVDFASLGKTSGTVEYTVGEVTYLLDLDLGIAYVNDATEYTLKSASGYYFSIVDGKGRVNVVNVIRENVKYIDEAKTRGMYTDSNNTGATYNVNFTTMQASLGGYVYDMYTEVAIVEYVEGTSVIETMVDLNNGFAKLKNGAVLYKSANGSTFIINEADASVQKVADLQIDKVAFSIDVNGTPTEYEVDMDDMKSVYGANPFVYDYDINGAYGVRVDLKAMIASVRTFYTISKVDSYYAFETELTSYLVNEELIDTEWANVKVYQDVGRNKVYYLYLDKMIAREVSNLYTFTALTASDYAQYERNVIGVISKEQNGSTVSIEVEIGSLSYNIYRNGDLYSTTALYDVEFESINPELISGNSWKGFLSLDAQNAGNYEIGAGSLTIGSNYSITYVGGITYYIEKARLTIEFTDPNNDLYEGNFKVIPYEVIGLMYGDEVNVDARYEGDNLNVTEGGYRLKVTIDSDNYYLDGGVSEWYYIKPIAMDKIVFTPVTGIIYDGEKHYLALNDVEQGAEVSYVGYETAPYFVAPGSYAVTAIVSKLPNYVSQEVELTLTIGKAIYTVKANEVPGTFTYGDPLPALTCNSDLGYITLDAGQILLPSVTTYTWTFTPNSEDFYAYYEGKPEDGGLIKGTVELTVNKAQAKVEVSGNLTQSKNDPSAILGIANGVTHNESDNVTIEYVDANGNKYATMPTAVGKYTVIVTYAGDEFYAPTTYTTTLTIEAESNLEWLYIVGGVLIVLFVLSTVFFLVKRNKKYE